MKVIIKFWNFRWFEYKNEELKSKDDRVEFSELLLYGEFIKIGENEKYEWQKQYFFWYQEKIWIIPFRELTENGEKVHFLITLHPSRRDTKNFLQNKF